MKFVTALMKHPTPIDPPIDVDETGLRAGKSALAPLAGRMQAARVACRAAVLLHALHPGSDDSPNRERQARIGNSNAPFSPFFS